MQKAVNDHAANLNMPSAYPETLITLRKFFGSLLSEKMAGPGMGTRI
jgi:hypothetical protein